MSFVSANGVDFPPPLQINLTSYVGWLWGENDNPYFRHIAIGSDLHTLVMIQLSRAYDLVVYICPLERVQLLKKYKGK